MKRLPSFFPFVCLLLALSVPPSATAATPHVVTTIRPLQLIVSAITEGVTEPDLLIPPGASYHHFTLRPSSMRSLTGASTVIWIGPELETWLSDVILQLPQDVDVITVTELEGLNTLPLVDNAVITGDAHHAGRIDPHLWLDHENARLVARAVTAELADLDEINARRYRDNLADFETALTRAHEAQTARLAPLADRDYVIYHNALQYFEHRHGLSPSLVFVQDDEIQPGIRQLRTVQQALAGQSPACLLLDSTANADVIRTILAGRELPGIRVDTVGEHVEPGPDGYVALLDSITASYEQCLSDGSQ
ncbi:MAG: zinc ABC transporter substrate-binding protein [Pseudomonadota bacterium]